MSASPAPIPAMPSAAPLKRCEERGKPPCTLHVVNNYTVTGADWRAQVPARAADAPDIGRLRPEPYWSMRGPSAPTGLIVWSHGYMAGKNATEGAPQPWTGRFTRIGLRPLSLRPGMDRRLGGRRHGAGRRRAQGARDGLSPRRAGRPIGRRLGVAGGAGARRAGRRRDLDRRGPPRRGDKMQRVTTRARSEWQNMVGALKPGPRVVLVNFAERYLRRRRPHGRCALGLRQERRDAVDHRQSRTASRATARPATWPSPASSAAASKGFIEQGDEAAALLGRIPTACTRRH